ncbi:MAG: zinc-dependent metalloprotease [Planctomycetia bacterium]|nr:zinc-dependent metalloprotease [Planctomycetia bacterium]
MKQLQPALLAVALFAATTATPALAQNETQAQPSSQIAAGDVVAQAAAKAEAASQEKYPPYADVLKDSVAIEGAIKLHLKGDQLYAELSPGQLNKDFLVVMAIAKGLGEFPLLGGMTFGDDALWQFRKVDGNIQIVRRNIRFKANPGSPEESAVKLAFTDSILFALPIATRGPGGTVIVDLSPVFMSDLPQIGSMLPGFMFSPNKSNWADVKGFENNVEIQVAATYASGGSLQLDTIPDSRGATVNVHYSISELPQTGYKPRIADDRVGYFLTAVKDFSKAGTDDQFVRYLTRWDLQKKDSSLELSPPVRPIIFYLEKTIPVKYRKPIAEGILEWNKAFEKAGFDRAIQVRQQEESDTWDPEDVRYNTIRWITSNMTFAMGPSRINPITGQILDADIIFDASWVQAWKQEYETFTPSTVAAMTGGPIDIKSYEAEMAKIPPALRHLLHCRCELHSGMSQQFAFGSALLMNKLTGPELAAEQEKLFMQGLKDVTMHEVGHTLGLRHNFKASTMLAIEDMQDPGKTKDTGLAASVMDYTPTNLAPKELKQGDYFSTTIGPYDMWAIEYGYKPLSGGTEGEVAELQKIATRGTEAGLAFSTDEDTRGIDPDPLSNRYDLGKDPLRFAQLRSSQIVELWPGIVEKVVKEGDGYERARQAVSVLLHNHAQAMFFAARYVGGSYVNRDHRGDPNAKAPFVVVEPSKQREALKLLEDNVFNDKPFQFPTELYGYLAPTRWDHWGSPVPSRTDYPAHEVVAILQDRMLAKLLSSLTLTRLHDAELKVPADQDAFTAAELLERLTKAVFVEIETVPAGEFSNRKPAISSLRRNLQRRYLKQLATVAMGDTYAPEDCQTVANMELEKLEGRIKATLAGNDKLDSYTQAHLQDSAKRIRKVLDAQLLTFSP